MAFDGFDLTDRMCRALDGWSEYSYGRKVDFPPDVRGIPDKLIETGSKCTDCSSFTWAMLTRVFPDAPWSFDYYKKYQMWERNDMWAPIKVVEALGIGKDGEGDGWYLYQVWKGQWEGGHSFLGFSSGGRLLVLEATNSTRKGIKNNGVVWRGIGPVGVQLPDMPEYCEHEATRGLTFSKTKLS